MNTNLVLVIFAMLLCGGLLWAQGTREVLVAQDFSSTTFPPTGWSISSNASNWTRNYSANAGGSSPELRFNYSPGLNGSTYFISPAVDTSGGTVLILDFRHYVDHYNTPYSVGVATRSGGGVWNTVWSVSPTTDLGPEFKTLTIANTDVGSTTFQFAFFFSGYSYYITGWYIDNIQLTKPNAYDLTVASSSVPAHVRAGTLIEPACTVTNAGTNPLTATASLSIYRGTVLDYCQEALSTALLDYSQTAELSFPGFTAALPDETYRFEFSVSPLEDVVEDDLSNNQLTAYTNTFVGIKQMVVLEISTATSCSFCPGAAMGAEDLIDGGYNVAVIQNHGSGDAFSNTYSNARNSYYNISGHPTAIFDGLLRYVGGSYSNSLFPIYLPLYQQRCNLITPLNIDIYGMPSREDYQITVRIEKVAPITNANLALHLVLTESNIAYAWQGQTQLHYVNRRMYPGAQGTSIDLASPANGFIDVVQTIAKNAAWVTANCELVAFIQDLGTKEIIQANKVALSALQPPPAALEEPVVSAIQSGSELTLSWEAVTGAVLYRVYGSDDPEVWDFVSPPLAEVSTNSYTAAITQNLGFFRVVAVSTAP